MERLSTLLADDERMSEHIRSSMALCKNGASDGQVRHALRLLRHLAPVLAAGPEASPAARDEDLAQAFRGTLQSLRVNAGE